MRKFYKYAKQLEAEGYPEEARTLRYLLFIRDDEVAIDTAELIAEGKLPEMKVQ